MTRKEALLILKSVLADLQRGAKDTDNVSCCLEHGFITYGKVKECIKTLEQETTTKNNLGVDAVSRKAVHDMLENLPITVEDKWFNWLQKACMRLAELPSVTPIQPKGHWIKTPKAVMGEGYMWYCDKCEYQVYQDSSRDYPSERYCPNCGADMRENKG